jgi:hypothetical protein
MDCDVPKKNVEKLRVVSVQNASDGGQFSAGNLPRLIVNLSEPEAPQKVGRRLFDDIDLIERKPVGIFSLLGNDHRLDAPKRGDLPVDVQHLRLEKCRAVKSNDRL